MPTKNPADPRRILRIIISTLIVVGSSVLVAVLLVLSGRPVDLYEGPVTNTAPMPGIEDIKDGQQVPTAGFEASPTPLGTPPTVPDNPDWRPLSLDRNDEIITWDACRPIHYVVNPLGAPEGTDVLLRQAVRDVSEATGLKFVDDGTTDEPYDSDRSDFQPQRYGDRWAPVLISWAAKDDREVRGADNEEILGHARPDARGDDGDFTYVSGNIRLFSDSMALSMKTEFGRGEVLGVMRHELGHLVGLGHVEDNAELMDATLDQATDFGPGDRAGLAALGAGECDPRL